MAAKLILSTVDQNDNKETVTIGKAADSLNTAAGFQAIDTAMRSIIGISNNTYNDTTYQINYSVNEELED